MSLVDVILPAAHARSLTASTTGETGESGETGETGVAPSETAGSCLDRDDSNTICQFVYEISGENTRAAEIADWAFARPMAILGLLLLGLLARWVIHRVIDRITTQAGTGTIPGMLQRGKAQAVLESTAPGMERREQRAGAMGSLLKSIATSVIAAVVAFMVIAQLGYNIAPLIASAGIIGIALGFGAQSLVQDFLSGIFMILEDQYGVGDVVDVGEASGTVEAVGLRVTRVRDVNGTVWYVRNGEILRVGNQSQNWARTVLDIPVSYDADLDRIREMLHEVAVELWEDPAWRGFVLEEPEVWGVESWTVDGIVMRVVLKTAPLKQWEVAREMRETIKDRFDAEGIHIPLGERVVRVRHSGPRGDGDDDAAAAEAALGDETGDTPR